VEAAEAGTTAQDAPGAEGDAPADARS
jgi:hypothetical protein